MMTTNTEDEEMRHGTMMCGDHTQKVISMLKSSNEVLKPLRYI